MPLPSRPAVLALALLLPAAALGDLFSPGPLSKPHAKLEGLKACTQCHAAGQQLSPDKCLACHPEIGSRLAQGKGFHGRLPEADRACETCHHEHQGREFALIEWQPSKAGFDHGKTGFPLVGKHAGKDCAACHTPRLVADPAVKKLLAEQPGRETLLGLGTRCNACHFDEHRGQLGTDCNRCHSEKGFKPPTSFDHEKTAFPLEGKHATVDCARCHVREEDRATPKDTVPAPRQPTFLRFKGVAHASCTDCHKDPHGGRLGAQCVSCHTPAGWKQVRSLEKERGFHEKTRFPLRGAHAAAECRACHGQPPRYRGLPFKQCADCHADAHVGQIDGTGPGKPPDCARCHGNTSFKPAAFEMEDHARTAYPLEGAHRAVACSLCHPQDPHLAERVPPKVREAFRKQRRPERFSFARFDVPARRCEECHADPHAGQFAAAGHTDCTRCHSREGFLPVRFDHARDTRWPLTGKHAAVACATCHRSEQVRGKPVVRYRQTPTRCDACHADPHAGQFAAGGATDCTRCHATVGFLPARFEHRPPATTFVLEGRHAGLACQKCHPDVPVAPGVSARRYKPLPRDCQGCHEDFHQGRFAGRESLSARTGPAPTASPATGTRCEGCHDVTGFTGAAIVHDRTGFPLRGAHAQARCEACHGGDFASSRPTQCAGCHRDVHGGELGQRCEGCHDESNWRSRFDASAHRRTNFPLAGRHALIPCEECHQDVRGRGFRNAALSCFDCHAKDYQRTALGSIDHAASGFSTRCQECHDPWRFSRARFEQHDACFEVTRGEHAGVRCLDCHTSLAGAQASGTCSTRTAACSSCHEHTCAKTDRKHAEVPGYQCKDRKCYECHRFSGGER